MHLNKPFKNNSYSTSLPKLNPEEGVLRPHLILTPTLMGLYSLIMTEKRPVVFGSESLAYVESLLHEYRQDPSNIPQEWQETFAAEEEEAKDVQGRALTPQIGPRSIFNPASSQNGRPAWSGAPIPEPTRTPSPATVQFLQRLPLFSELPNEALTLIASLTTEEDFKKGDVLFQAGGQSSAVYFVQSGEVELSRADEFIARLGAGEVLGEMSVMDNKPHSTDVRALSPVKVLQLSSENLYALLDKHGEIARGLFHTVTQRLRETNARQERVDLLIRSYRVRGHAVANMNPLSPSIGEHPELTLEHHGLSKRDLKLSFATRTYFQGAKDQELGQLLSHLQETYCGSIGVQFMHIDNPDVKNWLYTRMEATQNRRRMSHDEQLRILRKLTDAEIFEDFIHKKYLGAKRFSLEGGETLIPLMDLAIESLTRHGTRHVIIGMAHRGRLNVMANILGKSPVQIFSEFEDKDPQAALGRGDVKYHLGFSSVRQSADKVETNLSLCFNPSHLEFVAPVVTGRVRARQDRIGDAERSQVAGIVIHGDAAFAGQGIVQETLNMSGLKGYETGGTIHIIVNNQVGFTTNPDESRTSMYATDVAKMLDIPIFHVNGEDPDAVSHVVDLACAFRARWKRDVVIDMYCFRKYGHNEGDDPAFTQPKMYDNIRSRGTVRTHYLDNLIKLSGITKEDAEKVARASRNCLEESLNAARGNGQGISSPRVADEIIKVEEGCLIGSLGFEVFDEDAGTTTKVFIGGKDEDVAEVDTGLPVERLRALLLKQLEIPEDFSAYPKLNRLHKQRRAMAEGTKALDWGSAEAAAFASLVTEEVGIRVSGQDSGRGTFAHRHAIWHDTKTGKEYVPLQHMEEGQARCHLWNSPLSENSVLAFEFGYSLEMPEDLIIWEAQFGDFANGAQVIIDQFISCSEDKWDRLSGVVLLLPHGFEGQGPEHSSARLERFLTLSSQDNMRVVNLTTPAQLFHALRRHVKRQIRKPMVMMTPKSLLRHPRATSSLEELANGAYQKVIPDDVILPETTKKILLCSGKVYYDLLAEREKLDKNCIAIIRVEQLYPIPEKELEEALARYPAETPLVWVQEEPMNMGSWGFLLLRIGTRIFDRFTMTCICRPESASPATGSHASHQYEQQLLLTQALELKG